MMHSHYRHHNHRRRHDDFRMTAVPAMTMSPTFGDQASGIQEQRGDSGEPEDSLCGQMAFHFGETLGFE